MLMTSYKDLGRLSFSQLLPFIRLVAPKLIKK